MAKTLSKIPEKTPLKITFEDAAVQLERLCEQVNSLTEITPFIQELFSESKEDLASAVDRRIRFIRYAESQIPYSEKMAKDWKRRAKSFETIVDSVERNTIEFMKAYPDLPYVGALGSLRVQKNPPKLVFDNEDEFREKNTEFLLVKHTVDIDKDRIRKLLNEGKSIEGVRFEQGDQLRINGTKVRQLE